MPDWKKTKYVGVRFRQSQTRRYQGRKEKYFSIRYKRAGRTIEEAVGWESEIVNGHNVNAQHASRIRGEITANIRVGSGYQSLKEIRAAGEAKRQAEIHSSVTIGKAFDDFLSVRTLKARTVKDYQKFMDTVFKDWGRRTIKSITRDMVSLKHKELGDSVGHAQANQAFRFMRSLLNFCIAKYHGPEDQPLIAHNPVLILGQTGQWFRVQRRETIIRDPDLPKWYEALMAMKSEVVRDYLLTLLLSGLRRNEALSLEKSMVDLEERSISLLDTKNNKPFLIPIPNYLFKVLKARIKINGTNKYIFPSRVKGRHITEPQSGIDGIIEASGVQFCSHDLRRLFITKAEALDLSPFVIKRLVNHSVGSNSDTTAGYMISDLERLRKPSQQIEDRILSLSGAKESGKVVKLKRA